ncbi:MAG: hypothetical protein M3Y87_11110 [Myxococcota bacterium]|nr:hypothetical protein [Myxococcota bacterium]
MRRFFLALPFIVLLALSAAGCECGPPPDGNTCTTSAQCRGGRVCVDGRCQTSTVTDAGDDGSTSACVPSCAEGELCVTGTCAPDGGPCASSDECGGDAYCDATLMRCIPYGVPPGRIADSMCSRIVVAGAFTPTVECQLTEAPAGDVFPLHLHVLATPMVVDFGIGRGPDEPRRPSIVAVFDDGEDGSSELPTGVIRILDGATCTQTAELGSLQLVSHSSPVALGDLTGDGVAEIVAYEAGGGVVAFTYDDTTSAWRVLWSSTRSDGTPYDIAGQGWAGPSIYDLDDDGSPEVLRGAVVLDASGVLIDETSAMLLDYSSTGTFAVVANVDDDPQVELVGGHGVWQWDVALRQWVVEAYATGGQPHGHVAIADFGAFPGGAAWPDTAPEVAVISSGTARIQTLDGTVVFGPVTLPGGGSGGPPTIADFDGDGVPEFGSAGANAYSVFDPDCGAARGGVCASAATTGVLWSQPAQDQSSNVTGSSVFDFEGDGRAEVVYGDECFVRVYDGESGDVLFSQSRSSCTWYENPVIADLDGDFNAEIVIGDNFNCPTPGFATGRDCAPFGLGPRNTDPLFPGVRCGGAEDCVSGVCDAGLCRCTADTDCCAGAGCEAAAFVCEVPPDGTAGTGNTCRASRPVGTRGIRVFGDGADRWVRSRTIWNQHAYSVTNVEENGAIPRTSAATRNWLTEGLNNFRQNVQGDAIPGAAPDLTSRGGDRICDATGGTAILRASVCNRGAEPVGGGIGVTFSRGDPAAGGTLICSAATVGDLAPGACEGVECAWSDPPAGGGTDLWIVADPAGDTRECREANNVTIARDVRCDGVM